MGCPRDTDLPPASTVVRPGPRPSVQSFHPLNEPRVFSRSEPDGNETDVEAWGSWPSPSWPQFPSPARRPTTPRSLPRRPRRVSYYKQIRPIFQAQCQGCHQPAKAGGGYVMTDFARLLAGGESKLAAIVPTKPEESNLLDQVTPEAGKAEMPKEKPLERGGARPDPPLGRARGQRRHPGRRPGPL